MARNVRIMKAISSLQLTVILLLGIAVLCLIGTLFPQGGDGTSSSLAPWISHLLSPHDIFHSIWFMGAGLLLCINLVLCMRHRLGFKRRSLLMLLLHGSILLIIAGYALGFMSIDGLMEIPEGQAVSEAVLKNGSSRDLGFSVRCDSFTVDYYENGMPKEYVSSLSFLKGGHVADRAQVMVNHPAGFEGVNFYQENFRTSLSASVIVANGKEKRYFRVAQGDVIPLSPAGVQARVVKIRGDLMHAGPAVKLIINDPSGERYLWVFKDINALRARMPDLLERMPGFDPSSFSPYTFSLERIEPSYVTGIGVRHDPGIPLVAFGGALFLVSLLLVLAVPRTGQKKSWSVKKDASDASHTAARKEFVGHAQGEGGKA